MANTGRQGRRRRGLGYDGCAIDLIAFLAVAALLLWGVRKWNRMEHRPFGLPAIPHPHIALPHLSMPHISWPFGRRDAAPAPAASPTPSAPASPAPASPAPAVPEASPTPEAPEVSPSPEPSTPPPAVDTVDEENAPKAVVVAVAPRVAASANPLSAAATALAAQGGTVALGLPDGGIALRQDAGKAGISVRLAQSPGSVRALALSGDGGAVYWLAGTGNRLYAYRIKTKSLRAFDLPAGSAGSFSFDALATLPGSAAGADVVALLGSSGAARFLDTGTGRLRDPAAVLPAEAAAAIDRPQTSLYIARAGSAATVLTVSGDGVAPGAAADIGLWTTADARRPDGWSKRNLEAAPAYSTLRLRDAGRAAVAVMPGAVALLAVPAGGQTLAAGQVWTAAWDPAAPDDGQPLALTTVSAEPDGMTGLWSAPERIALSKSGLWWVFGGFVFHAAHPGGDDKTESYLPWNGAGKKKVTALAADDTGVWVATDAGVRHIAPGKPAASNGYDGYVRVALGPSTAQPPSVKTAKLTQMAGEWEGTPYKWGGDTRQGIDCSGYVCQLLHGVGVSVPRQTVELASDPSAGHVVDELKYGDVLVYPGHCALYLGNGWTTEAMDTGVGKATIWMRKEAVVRRYLKGEARTAQAAKAG